MITRLIVTWDYKEFVKILRSFIIVRMTWQYIICGDNEISEYKIFWFFHDNITFFDCRFSMISRLIVTWEDKEFMKIGGSFMIVRMTGQYTICGDKEISDFKIPFIFTIKNIIKWYTSYEDMKHYDWTRHNLWVQRILRLQNLFHFRYLQDDRKIHNLWGHNRTLETIMFHEFNRSSLLEIERTFVKLMDC